MSLISNLWCFYLLKKMENGNKSYVSLSPSLSVPHFFLRMKFWVLKVKGKFLNNQIGVAMVDEHR